jgi:hypothetical protein
MTLTEFLLARIVDDEEHAGYLEACDCRSWWLGKDHAAGCPELVRAQCRALREVVQLHETIRAAYPGTSVESAPCCRVCSAGGEYPGDFPCETLRILAVPYADHPDWREEWRP